MIDRIIQVANLDPNKKRKNSNNLRVYLPIGIAPYLHTACGDGWKAPRFLILTDDE